jgi:hypothetical protein
MAGVFLNQLTFTVIAKNKMKVMVEIILSMYFQFLKY